MKKFNSRIVAIKAIVRCLKTSEPLPVILDNLYAEYELSAENIFFKQNKAFCTELVYSYFRNSGILNFILQKLVKKTNQLALEIKIALILGLYEIFMQAQNSEENSHAIVFEYVEFAKKINKKLSGLLNAVLRNGLRQKESLAEYLQNIQNDLDLISEKKHLSNNQIKKIAKYADLNMFFMKQISPELINQLILTSLNIPIPTYRINKLFQDDNFEILKNYEIFEKTCLYVRQQKNVKSIMYDLENQGILSRQGMASQIFVNKISDFIDKNQGNIWDACAGRGGKSLALLERGNKLVISSDINANRLEQLHKNFTRLKISKNDQPLILNFGLEELADIIKSKQNNELNLEKIKSENIKYLLIDSPCTTSGTIGRNPEVKNRIDQNSLDTTVLLQRQLFEKAWNFIESNSYIIYCTCSVFQKENEEQINNFINDFNAKLITQEYIVPSYFDKMFMGHDILYYAILQK